MKPGGIERNFPRSAPMFGKRMPLEPAHHLWFCASVQKHSGFLGIFVLAICVARGIEPNPVEIEIANLTIQHPAQARASMVYDPRLNVVARAKAMDLGRRAYFAHVDPDGYGPNKAVKLAGFNLPGWWGEALEANYIESIAGGYANAQAAFDGWMASAGHKRHILAETDFYAGQTRYGVGYAQVPGSPYNRYYVFISAPAETGAAQALEPYTEWRFNYFTPKAIDTHNDLSDSDGDSVPLLTEFALQFNPQARELFPSPVFNRVNRRIEWALPVRSDLGSVAAVVERSGDLQSWSAAGVQRSINVYSIDSQGAHGVMRLKVSRP